MGKILYTPHTPATQKIIHEVKTFITQCNLEKEIYLFVLILLYNIFLYLQYKAKNNFAYIFL